MKNGQDIPPHELSMQKAARTGQIVDEGTQLVFDDDVVRHFYGKVEQIWCCLIVASNQVEQYNDDKGLHPDRQLSITTGNETYGVIEVSSAPIGDRQEQIIAGVVSFQDTSDRKLVQNRNFDSTTIQQTLEIIERNAKLQALLVDDLLDVSRIFQGKLSLKVCSIDLVAMIDAALKTAKIIFS